VAAYVPGRVGRTGVRVGGDARVREAGVLAE
jgi:hypothetical protein